MTTSINEMTKKSLDLVRCGFSPEDAVEMATSGERVNGCRFSDAEMERIRENVWKEDPR